MIMTKVITNILHFSRSTGGTCC